MLGGCGRPKAGSGRGRGRGVRRQQRREHDIEDDYYSGSDSDNVRQHWEVSS
jgi:hypothetical protein